MTNRIPAGTLVRINFPENDEVHKMVGYVTIDEPYSGIRDQTWHTVQLFGLEYTYDFPYDELEVLP